MKKSSYKNINTNQVKIVFLLVGFLFFSIPLMADAKLISIGTPSDFVFFGNKVGIGTTTPAATLQVNGNAIFGTISASIATTTPLNVSFGSTYGNSAAGSANNLKWDLYTSGSAVNRYGIGMSVNLMEFQSGTSGALGFFVNQGTEAMRIISNSNVGIGTTNPTAKLQVPTGVISGLGGTFTGLGSAGNVVVMADNTGGLYSTSTASFISGNSLNFWGGTKNVNIWNGDAGVGNVGIGTTNPLVKLEINGALKLGNTVDACDSTKTGTFRYEASSGQSYLCDGKRWLNQKNCGLMTDDAGQAYGTVQIGGQCWMAENINLGTMLASGATTPNTTDNIIQKWCYNNDPAQCATNGGLYNWDEAMRGSQVAGARGVCPSGWHIPSDAEYNKLEKTVLGIVASPNAQYVCDFNTVNPNWWWRRCADDNATDSGGTYGAGKSLKAIGQGSGIGAGDDLAGFKGLLSGDRGTNGTYSGLGSNLSLLSSTPSGSSDAWSRYLNATYSTIYRSTRARTHGVSVRCVKNSEENQTVNLDSYGGTYINNFTINKDDASPNLSGSTLFTILQSGNVGIGATNPGQKLSVGDAYAQAATLAIYDVSNSPSIVLQRESAATGKDWKIENTAGVFTLSYGYGTTYPNAWGYPAFSINHDNVGIGTNGPTSKLQVPGGTISGLAAAFTGLGGGGGVLVMADNNGGLYSTSTTALIGTSNFWGGTKNGNIWNGDAGVGNVGIGTTTPNNKFQVLGLINFDNVDENTSVGKDAGLNLVSGAVGNTFFGFEAGKSTTTGGTSMANFNTAVGFVALTSNVTGAQNTAIGNMVLELNTTGSWNTGLGDAALSVNTSGYSNVAIGSYALKANTSGNNNLALGTSSLRWNTTGSTNAAIGSFALHRNSTGTDNIAVGYDALSFNTTGSGNTALGSSALYNLNIINNAYSNNTAIGYNTGAGIITGINNTIIGANVTGLAAGLSNNIIIADGAGNRRINIDSSGNVGIGTTTPGSQLEVYGTNPKVSSKKSDGSNAWASFSASGTLAANPRATFLIGSPSGDSITNVGFTVSPDVSTAAQKPAFIEVRTNPVNSASAYRVALQQSTSLVSIISSSNSGSTAGTPITLYTYGNTNQLYLDNSGNVGIGTSTPTQKLDVVGSIKLPSTTSATTGVIYKNATSFIHDFALPGTSANNTFVGLGSGNFTLTGSTAGQGSYNTGLGSYTLDALTTGAGNSAMGFSALSANTTGGANIANGIFSLAANTTGSANVANGIFSLFANTTGDGNTAIGYYAGYSNTTGASNVALGYEALYSNTIGTNNIAIGRGSLYNLNIIAGAGNNTAIGYNTALGITTGTNNTIIGANVTGLSATLANSILIADGAGNVRIYANNNGNVGIGTGTTTPAAKLDVSGTIKLGTDGAAFTSMGACTIASTAISTTPTNYTCTGVPASTAVAVSCSGAAAQSGSGTLYCRSTGTASQVACNTSAANVTAMTWACSWVRP